MFSNGFVQSFTFFINKNERIYHLQEGGRGQQWTTACGRWLAVGGFEPANLTCARSDLIRLTTAEEEIECGWLSHWERIQSALSDQIFMHQSNFETIRKPVNKCPRRVAVCNVLLLLLFVSVNLNTTVSFVSIVSYSDWQANPQTDRTSVNKKMAKSTNPDFYYLSVWSVICFCGCSHF